MPIITVYSGTIWLRASENIYTEPILNISKTVYGATLGELFDNLVEASVNVARESQRWALTNQPAGYTPSDGYWRVFVTLPDIIKCQSKSLPDNLDSTFDARVLTFDEIVGLATAHRHTLISLANTHLQLLLPGSSDLPDAPTIPLREIGLTDVLEEIAKIGWTGKDLNSILEIALKEHRIDAYNAMQKYDRRLAQFAANKNNQRLNDSNSKQSRKKRFWIF